MRVVVIFAILLMIWPDELFTQHRTAENGYYPANYNGDTFTGVVNSTNDATREVTLTYKDPNKGKTETLVCTLDDGYTFKFMDGTTRELKPSDFKWGAVFKVYYTVRVKKVDGKKTRVNTIFTIAGYPNEREERVYFKPFN
jgi:hypothetical protein